MASFLPTDKIDTDQIAPGPEFRSGDVVRLRSGGQNMTVLHARADQVSVVWMTEASELRRENLNPVLLYRPTITLS